MKTYNYLLFIVRAIIIVVYGNAINDVNIFYFFLVLELFSNFIFKNSKELFLLNIILLCFIISSVSLDLSRDINLGINKSGNELAFFEIITELSKVKVDIENLIQFYIVYEDVLFILINVLFFKILHLNAFFNLVILNNYLASWAILLIWKSFRIKSFKPAVFSSIGVLLFYASTGLRDLLGLFLFSLSFYLYNSKLGRYKYFIIAVFVVLQYFIRPLNAALMVTFILAVYLFQNSKISKFTVAIYLIGSMFLIKFSINSLLKDFFESFNAWKNNYDERIVVNSGNSILAQLRYSPIGFVIPLLITSFGESPLIIFNFSNFGVEHLLLSITSIYTVMTLFLVFFYLFNPVRNEYYNILLLISSVHSFIIFFLTDETRHRLFFLLLISIILTYNYFDESSSVNRDSIKRNGL